MNNRKKPQIKSCTKRIKISWTDQYSMQVSMEYWRILMFTLGVHVSIAYNNAEVEKLVFLVPGPVLQYATTLNITTFNLEIEINFDADLIKLSRAGIELIFHEWQNYPAFVADPVFAAKYVALMQRAVRNWREANVFHDEILKYVLVKDKRPISSTCNYTVTGITKDEIERALFNIKDAWERCNPLWTKDDLTKSLDKSNTLRLFHVTLDTEVLALHEDMATTLSLIDSLSSSIFPEYVRGLYQTSNCISEKYSEEIVVRYCTGYSNMYVCQIEIQDPLAIYKVTEMIPIMYKGLILTGEHPSQRFIQTQSDGRIQLLDCNEEALDTQKIPICQTKKLDAACEFALGKNDILSVIKFCNFTRPTENTPGKRLSDGSVLGQGDDIRVKLRRDGETKILTSANPCRIYSNAEIIVDSGQESYSFMGNINFTEDKVIESLLTKEQIDKLVAEYKWRENMKIFTWQQIIDFVLIGLELILLPMSIAALVITFQEKGCGKGCRRGCNKGCGTGCGTGCGAGCGTGCCGEPKKKRKDKRATYNSNERMLIRMNYK